MNIPDMIDALVGELQFATASLQLQTPKGDIRNPQVADGYLAAKDPKNPNLLEDFPYVIARYLSDSTTDDESIANVKILCGVYSNDERQGWRDLLNLMNAIKTHLLSKQYFGERFEIQRPLKREIPEGQAAPEWSGWLTLNILIPNIMEVDKDVLKFFTGN
jgi:hypothetical protein